MNDPVSIVVASYNYERFIATTLEAIRMQTSSAWEALVVDDGSRDDSVGIIRRFCDSDPRFTLLQHEGGRNRGLAETLQLGVRHATGRWAAGPTRRRQVPHRTRRPEKPRRQRHLASERQASPRCR